MRAGAARLRIGASHHAHDQVAGAETAVVRCLDHTAEGLVAEDQPVVVRRCLAVRARGDLPVRAADAEGEALDQ
ncbi:hypothetical protein GCM10010279_26950 [Streptomyces mutabilis]|nr:hypothetical protein GCM10010279_26950 [Streptomyces mutabilis]